MAEIKIALCGPFSVGCSALMVRFVQNVVCPEFEPTIINEYRKQVTVDEEPVLVNILDGYGSDSVTPWRDDYVRTCHGLCIVYSITDLATFKMVDEFAEADFQRGPHLRNTDRIILIGSKLDLERDRVVERRMGEAKAHANGWMFEETSATEDINVGKAFHAVIAACVRHMKETGKLPQRPPQHRATRGACVLQ